jgi:hypothetical protein
MADKLSKIVYPVTKVNNKTGDVTLGKSDVGLGNVDNVKQYSSSNPPPYPVTKVNNKTGAVTLGKSDVGLGNVENVRQYSAQNPPPYPVRSVNGQTGDVTVQAATDEQVKNAVDTWLDNNVDPATGYVLDNSLTMSNAAPPASAVGKIRDLKMTNLIDGAAWAIGSINVADGQNIASGTRIRTNNYIPLDGVLTIKVTIGTGYKYVVDWYDSNKSPVNTTIYGAWQTANQEITIPNGVAYMRLLVANTSDGAASLTYSAQLTCLGLYAINKLSDRITDAVNDVADLDTYIHNFAVLDDVKFTQFIKQSEFDGGKYYQYNSATNTVFTTDNSGYKVLTIEIPAGTYNFKNINGTFSFVRNKSTFSVVQFTTLNGGQTANSSGTFTIDYDAIFYITGGFYQTINLLSAGPLPATQVEGDYSVGKIGTRRIFKCGANEFFTKFYDALAYAMQFENSILYVESGTYDLVAELGADYFANFTHSADGWGIYIGNGVEVICSEGAVFTCNYTGDNAEVHTYFSPLNAKRVADENNDFILRGMNISAKNCRYVVHDECAVVTIPYRHIYDSCIMHLDNSSSLSTLNTRQTIGGGLGYHGYVEIKDSIFSCDGGWTGVDVVSYHNSSAPDAKSKIVCTGNYCEDASTFRFSAYGTQSTNITTVIASNNSLGAAISTRKETADAGDNVLVRQWNNEIRS